MLMLSKDHLKERNNAMRTHSGHEAIFINPSYITEKYTAHAQV